MELHQLNESRTSLPASANPALRNVELMFRELSTLGYITPELRAMILDEELTHAAEIVAVQEDGYAAIPRSYEQAGNDLIDIHGQSLRRVFDDGIEYSRREITQGVPGARWELERRTAESKNLNEILAMPGGTVCVEISASPFDKPENEQRAQHYTGLTMIRASFKDTTGKVAQYNYALPVSSPEFLALVQQKLGREDARTPFSSLELLQNPIIEEFDLSPEMAARKIDNLIGAALLEVSVGQSALRMITKAIENRREAWEFVTDAEHQDLHHELLAAVQYAAGLPEGQRAQAMDAIRSGFWKEFKDRFQGRAYAARAGGIIMAAAERAVADGDVFIACGSTVIATGFSSEGSPSGAAARAEIVKNLLEKVVGNGSCISCGAKGKLFGCKLCSACNKTWCDEYVRTGKQTDIKNLSYLRYARPRTADEEEGIISRDLRRINDQLRERRRLNKQREEAAKQRLAA